MIKILLLTILLRDEAPKSVADTLTARKVYDSFLEILEHPVCANHKPVKEEDRYLRMRYRGAFSFFWHVTAYDYSMTTYNDCCYCGHRHRYLRQTVAGLKKWEDENIDRLSVDDIWDKLKELECFFHRDHNKIYYSEPYCFMY